MKFKIIAVALMVVGIVAAPGLTELDDSILYAQLDKRDTSQSDFVIKTKVMLVPIETVVRNRKGEFVDRLRADNFEIYDNSVVQQIGLFTRENKPLDVALIVDSSGSEKRYIKKLREIARDVLNELNSQEDRVALFSFNNFPIQLTNLSLDRSFVAGSIDRIPQGGGGTNILAALWDATQYLRMQPQEHRRAIILISDNVDPNFSVPSSQELLREMLESTILLYSIKTSGDNMDWVLPKENDPNVVAKVAKETGGDILETNSVDALFSALNAAVQRLKNSYLIGFSPSVEGNEGSYHKLTIKLKPNVECSGCKVQARKGYYAGGHAAPMSDKNNSRLKSCQ